MSAEGHAEAVGGVPGGEAPQAQQGREGRVPQKFTYHPFIGSGSIKTLLEKLAQPGEFDWLAFDRYQLRNRRDRKVTRDIVERISI
jgi:hypothetical protein